MIQDCNPEIGLVNSTCKFAKMPWVNGKWSRQRSTHDWFLAVLRRPSDPINCQIWYHLDTVNHPVWCAWTSGISAVWNACVFWYLGCSPPEISYITWICRITQAWAPLTIRSGWASNAVWSWCCWVFAQHSEKDYPPCLSTWQRAVVEIDPWALRWILGENVMRLLINRADGTMWHSPRIRMIRTILAFSIVSTCG